MKRAKIGDIIEIRTNLGLAYAQYTHRNKEFGALIRVFSEIFQSRPESLEQLVLSGSVRFSTFFLLQAALNRKIFEVVSNEPVREALQKFPMFRAGFPNPISKKVESWWLWDGEKEWQIGKLSPEQRKFPIRGTWNDTLLITRIETGWTPEKDNR